MPKSEFFLPSAVNKRITEENKTVRVLETAEKWYGVTYKEDKQNVVNALKKKIKDGYYPEKLW